MSATPTRRRRLTIVFALAYCCMAATTSFGFVMPPTPVSPLILLRRATTTTALQKERSFVSGRAKSLFVIVLKSSSSREEEIAKLEQQLRDLKNQQEQDDPTSTTEGAVSEVAYTDKRKKNIVNDRGVREILPGKDMILSEQDLVDSQLLDSSSSSDTNKGLFGVMPTIVIGLIAAVALFFFAQVPVGQEDYIRYSAAPTTNSKTIDLGDLNMDIQR